MNVHPTASGGSSLEPWRRNLRGEEGLDGPRDDSWWTGLAPVPGVCPGVGDDGVIRGLPLPDLSRCSRADLLAYFESGWATTEVLFAGFVGEEAFYRPPWHALRHPMVFYYAHPAALYVNKLRLAGLRDGPVNAAFEQLFETGVDEMSWDDLAKNEALWPRISEARAYRREVHDLVAEVIRTHPDLERPPLPLSSPLWAVLMGCEHERIHIETSSVLVRELPERLVRRHPAWPPPHDSARRSSPAEPPDDGPPLVFRDVEPGESRIGKPRDWPSYGWDNEYGSRTIHVPAFAACERLVTNAEWHAFVVDGGYRNPEWWSEPGWRWRTFRNAKCPTFWQPTGPAGLHQYRLRTIFETVAMPWDWPAVVNAHEAEAYAAWRSARDGVVYRLPTEAEHHRMRGNRTATPDDDPAMRLSGADMPARAGYDLALACGSEWPVTEGRANDLGLRDLFGNVWQWCTDHFAALPGFDVDPLYDDFSTPCFDGEHQVILGGSFASLGDEASVFARFHFRPHFHQHAGVRLVRPADPDAFVETTCCDAPPPHVGAGPCCTREGGRNAGRRSGYESDESRDAYLLLHYGDADATLGNLPGPRSAVGFPGRVADLVIGWAERSGAGFGRALDVGCAVGGSSVALARRYAEVVGIDLSASFVAAARTLAERGHLAYRRIDEGVLKTEFEAVVPEDVDRTRLEFRRGDASALPADLGRFDAVLLGNLLCRLPSPRACLARMGGPGGLVRPGGLLVATTPATWRPSSTPPGAWLGGYERDGVPVTTLDGLHAELDPDFELLHTENVPFLLREHARKFEYVVALGSVWRRRP